jgi:hypothetical protein
MDRLSAFFDFNPVSTPKEPSVNAILKERIGERVSALQISWRRASLEAGLEAGFIQDVITGPLQASRRGCPGEPCCSAQVQPCVSHGPM